MMNDVLYEINYWRISSDLKHMYFIDSKFKSEEQILITFPLNTKRFLG